MNSIREQILLYSLYMFFLSFTSLFLARRSGDESGMRAHSSRKNKINETSKRRTVKYIFGVPRNLATTETAENGQLYRHHDHNSACVKTKVWSKWTYCVLARNHRWLLASPIIVTLSGRMWILHWWPSRLKVDSSYSFSWFVVQLGFFAFR